MRKLRVIISAVSVGLLWGALAVAQPLPTLCPARCLRVFWTPTLDADGYIVRWGTASGVYTGSFDAGHGILRGEERLADIGKLQTGVDYYVVVQAYNRSTGLMSASSAEVKTGTPTQVPAPRAPMAVRVSEN